mgnify:FL=1
MKRALLILSALVTFIGSANAAAPSCLKTVSDDDLLAEVAVRMNTRTTPTEGALATFSCRFQTMTVSLVDAASGNEQREDMNVTDANSCTALETFLSTRVGNRALTKAAIVAGCRFQTLMRMSMNPTGTIKRLQDQNLTDAAACNVARERINDAL